MACLWLEFGKQEKCEDAADDENCTQSWVYSEGFDNKPPTT